MASRVIVNPLATSSAAPGASAEVPSFAAAVEAMERARGRDQVVAAFARGVASYLLGVKGYVLAGGELRELFSLSPAGFRRSPPKTSLSVGSRPEISQALDQGTPFVGTTDTVQDWAELLAPAPLGPHGVAVMPAAIRGRVVCLLLGALAYPPDDGLRGALATLCDAAGLALARALMVGRSPNADAAPPSTSPEPRRAAPEREPSEQQDTSRAPTSDLDLAFVEMVISSKVSVPPYPGVASRLNAVISSGDFGLRELTDVIRSDPSLSADVLRHANSTHFAGGAKVTSLDQAVSRIGARTLVGLALSAKLGPMANAEGPLLELKHRIWRQAVAAAALCEQLAVGRGLDRGEAFICGLLHDFGRVIATACVEQLVAQGGATTGAQTLEHWAEVVERYHVELGRIVSERWNLPESITMTIVAHHRPVLAGEHRVMVDLVICVDEIVSLLERESHLSEQLLGAVPGLAAEELETVLAFLPQLPLLIGELKGGRDGAAPKDGGPSLVHRPAGVLEGPLAAVSLPVVHRTQNIGYTYTACQLGPAGIVLRGRDAMRINALVSLEIDGGAAGPLALWMRVSSCNEGGGEQLVELAPYALNQQGLADWLAFCERVQRGGQR